MQEHYKQGGKNLHRHKNRAHDTIDGPAKGYVLSGRTGAGMAMRATHLRTTLSRAPRS
jgi:hypothetical protein